MKNLNKPILFPVLAFFVVFSAYLHFRSDKFFEGDAYYHLAVSQKIMQSGLHYPFEWAEYSTFKNNFSDKDLLFHLSIIPFLKIFRDPVTAGKTAAVFFNFLLLIVLAWVLQEYIPSGRVALILAALFVSPGFLIPFFQLRPATLSLIISIPAVYCLIRTKSFIAGFLCLLYALAHISFPVMAVFAVLVETARLFTDRKICLRNIVCTLAGMACGLALHPNFPYNLLSVSLNAIKVPFNTFTGNFSPFGMEFFPLTSREMLIDNFFVFAGLFCIFLIMLRQSRQAGFETAAWWLCFAVYLFFAFLGRRFWFPAVVFFSVFIASFTAKNTPSLTLVLPVLAALLISPASLDRVKSEFRYFIRVNSGYQEACVWMDKNLQPGEIVYHTSWSDSPRLAFFSPKNRYLVMLDPVYMMNYSMKIYGLYERINSVSIINPEIYIKNVFHSTAVFSQKTYPLCRYMANNRKKFDVLFENDFCILFRIV